MNMLCKIGIHFWSRSRETRSLGIFPRNPQRETRYQMPDRLTERFEVLLLSKCDRCGKVKTSNWIYEEGRGYFGG